MKPNLSRLFQEFLESKQASGAILIFCMGISIAIANSPFGTIYTDCWHTSIGFEIGGLTFRHEIEYWINEGLMAIFFLLIGLEIERELYLGELSSVRKATLPVIAAIGGMAAPAALHFLFNHGTETQAGIGIPIATDIAFALGVMALLGDKTPLALKVFLAALAIIDDLGSIIIIALFYQDGFSPLYLLLSAGVFAGLVLLNRLHVRPLPLYLVPGLLMWYFMSKSGIHPSVAGVLLAFVVPFARNCQESPSCQLQHFLHKPVAFFILPLFALANTGIVLSGNWIGGLATVNSLGILLGLFIGKPAGIVLFTFLAVKSGFARLPDQTSWRHIIGIGFLGGIGFTMSTFITMLAFKDPGTILSSKISIFLASTAAGCVGLIVLGRKQPTNTVNEQDATRRGSPIFLRDDMS